MNWFEILNAVVLTLFTGGLLVATIFLAKHTKTLARVTADLVHIENAREERFRSERRRSEIERALKLSVEIMGISPQQFLAAIQTYITEPHPGNPILKWAESIRHLALMKSHFHNHDLVAGDSVEQLVWIVDDVTQRNINRSQDPSVKNYLVRLQERLLTSITAWRYELGSTDQT